ncbi:MAG TPA: protein kinase [Polyangiaceae bacterium]|nr:protein kinase [Polyangiaceae bacterium]
MFLGEDVHAERFRGTSRFVIEGCLGHGGMGVVHRVRDTQRDEVVALKTMTRVDPGALLRFKREFRALADISHPNVVQLYELFSEGDDWFFTMELVEGCDLLTWIQTSLSVPPPPPSMPGDVPTEGGDRGGRSADPPTLPAPTELYDALLEDRPDALSRLSRAILGARARVRFSIRNPARLREAFRQLAAGVRAIHAAGRLHRDIKPSNVMVTRAGRVVLLDFGVAGEYRPGTKGERLDEPLVGTPAYMAPEQAAFQPATPASDWYSVGVILYEALTRRMPFEGSTSDILLAKQQPLMAPPSALVEGVPQDLERLCVDLLGIDPRTRPTGDQVVERLRPVTTVRTLERSESSDDTPEGLRTLERGKSSDNAPDDDRAPAIASITDGPFVGRRAQLDELHAALTASLTGPPGIVMLRGRSGMGKSALASRFLGGLAGRNDVLVFSGRCYEREAVPFKAVDQVIDELTRWLSRMPEDEAYSLLPQGIHALARIFPVLRNARVVTQAADHDGEIAERLEIRRRAFAALKELIGAIAQRAAVVVHVDDLHWGDADSLQLLEALLSPPAPRPLLLVCAHRPEAASSSDALAAMTALRERLADACDFRDVDLDELPPAEAQDLARTLLGSAEDAVVEAIATEARGSPLFVAELARWAGERREIAPAVALDQVILARVAELPDDARTLLETLCVAAGPLRHGFAAKAAGLGGGHRAAAIGLRNARFVSMRGLGEDDVIETAHDRVRQTVFASLGDAQRRARHLALAHALSSSDGADPEAAFVHFREAGEAERARDYALRAAEAADRGLAFSLAASLYRAAIAAGAGPAGPLYAKLGDALANAGRGAEAADAYMAAADASPAHQATDLKRVAAEHYLKSGLDERGIAVLRGVLAEAGVRYPESTEGVVASLVWAETRLRVATLVRRVHRPQSLSTRKLARIDAAFTAATGLIMTDLLRSADFASRALLLALEAGEPVRLGRALAIAAGNTAARGEVARGRADELAHAAERVAAQVDDPHGRALALLAAGFVHFFMGEWRGAREKLAEAETILRARCRAVAWELANAQAWICNALILSGQLREAARRVPPALEEARARGDRFAQMHLIYPACCAYIVADDVDAARRVTEYAGVLGESGTPTAAQWGAFISACSVDRYEGNAAAAWDRVRSASPALDSSNLVRAALVRVCSAYERGLTAVAAAAAGHDRTRALRAAHGYARRLAREKAAYGRAMGLLLIAGAYAAEGEATRATEALERAVPALDAADLPYLAACARQRLGQVSGGDRRRELLAQSRAFFEAEGVVRPERCVAMTAPGFEGAGR